MYILYLNMSYTVVTTKIDPKTKKEAMKTASDLGLSLSAVVKALLKQFIRTKQLSIGINEDPNQYLINSFKKSNQDIKAGKTLSFKKGTDALSYIDSLIDNDRQNRSK